MFFVFYNDVDFMTPRIFGFSLKIDELYSKNFKKLKKNLILNNNKKSQFWSKI